LAVAKAFYFVRFVLLFWALGVAGCAEQTTALLQTVRQVVSRDNSAAADAFKLDPRYRYLRVTHEGGVAILILGGVDKDARGTIQTWYGADATFLKLQNGRFVGNTGLQAEWRSVTVPDLPAWSTLAAERKPVHWERIRDVMPGYRYGIRDQLVLSVVPTPRATGLVRMDPQQLVWFEERTEASTDERLPPARYAVQGDIVVYCEQCVSARNCIKWQRWPAGGA
jgi:hypothetical protein